MTLPKPNLNNKSFQELVEEASKLIPLKAPEWADHNVDPWINFVELFTWLMEIKHCEPLKDINKLIYLCQYTKGITVILSGSSGTGKTMAAEAIAAGASLDLYKIDLSQVISKYIGETEENLKRIFDDPKYTNVILFFDEADELFGKRNEVLDCRKYLFKVFQELIYGSKSVVLIAANIGSDNECIESLGDKVIFIDLDKIHRELNTPKTDK
ncbi:MAG: AAA family ATPase [Methanobacteriaceae archaeon]|nr:AAA family ATPase [Methanobacteriaceae archaeon]